MNLVFGCGKLSYMDSVIQASVELIAVIERNFESKSLDYKGPIAWDSRDKKACCELTKDVMGMANTEGGFIVIGVSELQHGFSLVGLTPEQANSFESSVICRFIQNYVDPPINVRVQKVLHKDRVFVVLEVPKFTDTPHICQKDYPDVLRDRELYVRTDNNETAPIKSSADFRLVVESAIRNRADNLLSSFRAILTGANANILNRPPSVDQLFGSQIEAARIQFETLNPLKGKNYTFFAETIFSLHEFDQYRFPPQSLELAAHKACVEFRGWPFLFIHNNRSDCLSMTDDGLESLISTQDFSGNDLLDFWRLNESGLFYKRELLPEAASNPPIASIPGIAYHFAEAIYCLTRLYEPLLTNTDAVTLKVTLLGTRGRGLVWNVLSPRFGHGRYQANRPEISIQRTQSLADWRAGIEDHAVQMTREMLAYFYLELPDLGQIQNYVKGLFQRKF
jgi:hypothetical protein